MASNLSAQLLLKGVQSVEIFTGVDEQDPLTWLQNIEELFEATKVDKNDRRRLLPMYFGDDVKKWYRSEDHSSDYDDFKNQFVNAFTSSVHKLKISTKLMNRRQGNDESVQSYYYDILALCARFNPEMREDEKILYLLLGLKPSIQQHVIISDPKKCKDLFEHAKRTEAAAAIIQPVSIETSTIYEHHEETTAALRHAITNRNNRPMDYSNANKKNKSSHRWSQQYHTNWFYQYPRRTSSQLKCYNCHGVGHYAYQCPSHLN
ncbi:unnamed protein product [Rotaria socialis]|uniref:CCHC-type domain-containing protein n=1 Tax=Rotaria socialis TaxID=392032 RepID=A0A821E5J0_9BILA|nr:unnamed protein product [Rotaria socialis]CAF4631396.1 unnamed protein product [Rotaria socialis]